MAVLRKGRDLCRPIALPPSGINGKNTWAEATVSGANISFARNVWTDGKAIYYTNNYNNYVFNGYTWEPKTWYGEAIWEGYFIWTDGTNIYYSYNQLSRPESNNQFVLNGDTWIPKEWRYQDSNPSLILGDNIWTDGTSIYYSYGLSHYVLVGDTWEVKHWNVRFYGDQVWSDGVEIYMYADYDSDTAGNYQLIDGVWKRKEWNIDIAKAGNIWTDGINVYCSKGGQHYVLQNSSWYPQTWNGISDFSGGSVWSDGICLYFNKLFLGEGTKNFVLTDFTPPTPSRSPSAMMLGYQVGQAVRGMRK